MSAPPRGGIPGIRWRSNLRRWALRLTPLLALLLIGLVFYLGLYSERTGFVDRVLRPGLRGITHPVLSVFRGRTSAVPQLQLALADSAMADLSAQREAAIESSWLASHELVPVPLRITADGRELGGDVVPIEGSAVRFSAGRWALRVRLAAADTLLGMSVFDLRPVEDDGPLHGKLLLAAMAQEGAPIFPLQLVEVVLNDRDRGVYAMEQRVDLALLMRWARGSGPVLRYGDALRQGADADMGQRLFPSDTPSAGEWWSAPVLATTVVGQAGGADPLPRTRLAIQALEDLRNGTRAIGEVLDVEALARLITLADLFGAQDALAWWNLRFVADSVSGRLIPVPLKVSAGVPVRRATILLPYDEGGAQDDRFAPIIKAMSDTMVLAACVRWTEKVTTEQWLDSLLARETALVERLSRIATAELPEHTFVLDVVRHGRTVLRQTIRPRDPLLAYPSGHTGRLVVANTQGLPVLVKATIAGDDTLALRPPLLIPPRPTGQPLRYSTVRNDHRGGRSLDAVVVAVPGSSVDRVVRPRPISTLPAN